MRTETRPKPTSIVMAERRAEAADRRASNAAALADRRVEEAKSERDRSVAELADMREDRDRWRKQAERLAEALERLRSEPREPRSPQPAITATSHVFDENRDDVLYGVPAIAAVLRLKAQQVYHLKDRHGLPTFKIGRIVCARRSTLAHWIAKREAATTIEGAR